VRDGRRDGGGIVAGVRSTGLKDGECPLIHNANHIGRGKNLLDQMTKDFIRHYLSYRFMVCPSGAEALAIERDLRADQSPAGRPYLNPL
jgi:hypothetical protein